MLIYRYLVGPAVRRCVLPRERFSLLDPLETFRDVHFRRYQGHSGHQTHLI
jgi:hypothetical protein